jgi:hypothetical protein
MALTINHAYTAVGTDAGNGEVNKARWNAALTYTGTLDVANGGTGVTSSTGTGSTVLSASPALTGTPTAPTQTAGDNTTAIATTAFVTTAVAAGGGLTLLGTLTTTSGTSQTLSSLTLTSYKALYIVIKNVSLSSAGTGGYVAFEGIGGTKLTVNNSGGAATDTVMGFGIIDLLASSYFCISTLSNQAAGTSSSASGTNQSIFFGRHSMTTASTSIVFASGSGANAFDAGSIDVYGMK